MTKNGGAHPCGRHANPNAFHPTSRPVISAGETSVGPDDVSNITGFAGTIQFCLGRRRGRRWSVASPVSGLGFSVGILVLTTKWPYGARRR
jgi:hypothetical protein